MKVIYQLNQKGINLVKNFIQFNKLSEFFDEDIEGDTDLFCDAYILNEINFTGGGTKEYILGDVWGLDKTDDEMWNDSWDRIKEYLMIRPLSLFD